MLRNRTASICFLPLLWLLKAAGKLEFAPNAEERAELERQRVVELNRRDREGGSRAANAPWLAGEEDPGQSAGRLAVEAGKRYRTEAEQRKAEQAAEAARIAAESDLSCVPSLKSIIDANGAEIPWRNKKRCPESSTENIAGGCPTLACN